MTTANFSNLSRMNVTSDKTAEYSLYQIDGVDGNTPILILKPAHESNKPYYNALLRKSRSKMASISAKKITAETVKQNRDEDRALFADHVIAGWRHIPDSDGNDVEFSKENARAFFESLPVWIFDDMRTWAQDMTNYVDMADPEDTAKN